jgi:hypothetical protein
MICATVPESPVFVQTNSFVCEPWVVKSRDTMLVCGKANPSDVIDGTALGLTGSITHMSGIRAGVIFGGVGRGAAGFAACFALGPAASACTAGPGIDKRR